MAYGRARRHTSSFKEEERGSPRGEKGAVQLRSATCDKNRGAEKVRSKAQQGSYQGRAKGETFFLLKRG